MITREEVEQINARVTNDYAYTSFYMTDGFEIFYADNIRRHFKSRYIVACFSNYVAFLDMQSAHSRADLSMDDFKYSKLTADTYEKKLRNLLDKRTKEIVPILKQAEKESINSLLTEINNL